MINLLIAVAIQRAAQMQPVIIDASNQAGLDVQTQASLITIAIMVGLFFAGIGMVFLGLQALFKPKQVCLCDFCPQHGTIKIPS